MPHLQYYLEARVTTQKQRRTFEERSVLVWMLKGETYREAAKRLDALWATGQHPLQLQRQKQ